jgi:hypothetical protein
MTLYYVEIGSIVYYGRVPGGPSARKVRDCKRKVRDCKKVRTPRHYNMSVVGADLIFYIQIWIYLNIHEICKTNNIIFKNIYPLSHF